MDPGQRWDARYREREASDAQPCAVLSAYRHLLPREGTALDLAGGLGGNARLLAEHGLRTELWDCSTVAVDKVNELAASRGLPLQALQLDIEHGTLPDRRFDVVVASHFLYRERMPEYLGLLAAGGLLYWQTWTRETAAPGSGPANPAWRLAANELLHLCGGLRLLAYREEGLAGDLQQGLRGQAWIVAQRTCP